MKRTYKLILAGIATSLVLASCSDELFSGENGSAQPEGSRVIAISFGPQTRTALGDDGLTPEFKDEDEILLVSYPANSDPITEPRKVSVDKNTGVATISTNLTGDLMALYPAKYAKKMPNGKYGLPVPHVQTGKFCDANLCGTQIKDGDRSATFMNGTPLFIINPPTGAKSLTIKSLKQIGSDGQRTGDRYAVCLNEEGDVEYSISIPNEPDEDGNYYVAVAETNGHIKLSDLSFEVEYETSGTGAIKGIPTSVISEQAEELEKTSDEYNSVVYGTAYTINNSNWHPYVTVAGRKWATVNIGANAPEEYGRYFAWGDITGQEADLTIETIDAEKENAFETGFSEAPTLDPANPAILPLKYDAANANWGGAWRIPTKKEYEVLIALQSDESLNSGFNIGISPNQIFFPAAGGGDETSLASMTTDGHYWTSTLDVTDASKAVSFVFSDNLSNTPYATIWPFPRYLGSSVRAIIDDPDAVTPVPTPTESDYVEIEAKYDGTNVTKLKWYRQNLAISESGGKPWKGGNNSAVKVPGTNEDVIVGDYFQWAASYAGYNIEGDANRIPENLLLYTAFTNTGCGDSEDEFTFKNGKTFTKACAPYISGSSYTKYTSGSQNLDAIDDAANIILGGDWRMPTSAEFQAMMDATYWAWDNTDEGYYVYTPQEGDAGKKNDEKVSGNTYNKSDALLFLPVTGLGDGDYELNLNLAGIGGHYWSSTHSSNNTDNTEYLLLRSDEDWIFVNDDIRSFGFPIRPVAD